MLITCRQCGKKFNLSEGEVKFYKNKGLKLPKRCAECRKLNKSKKQIKQQKAVSNKPEKEEIKLDLNTKNINDDDKKYFSSKKSNIIYLFVFIILSLIIAYLGFNYSINM